MQHPAKQKGPKGQRHHAKPPYGFSRRLGKRPSEDVAECELGKRKEELELAPPPKDESSAEYEA